MNGGKTASVWHSLFKGKKVLHVSSTAGRSRLRQEWFGCVLLHQIDCTHEKTIAGVYLVSVERITYTNRISAGRNSSESLKYVRQAQVIVSCHLSYRSAYKRDYVCLSFLFAVP